MDLRKLRLDEPMMNTLSEERTNMKGTMHG